MAQTRFWIWCIFSKRWLWGKKMIFFMSLLCDFKPEDRVVYFSSVLKLRRHKESVEMRSCLFNLETKLTRQHVLTIVALILANNRVSFWTQLKWVFANEVSNQSDKCYVKTRSTSLKTYFFVHFSEGNFFLL